MGPRLRMKQSYDCSSFSEPARVICAGLERYGMIVADDGSDGYLSGAPDPRWDDDALWDLKQIVGDAFEVVDTGPSSGSDEGLAGSGVRGEGRRGNEEPPATTREHTPSVPDPCPLTPNPFASPLAPCPLPLAPYHSPRCWS